MFTQQDCQPFDLLTFPSHSWEHLQPLLRYYEYSQGVEIHVAGWPPFWDKPKDIPWPHHVTAEAERMSCQFMAMEGACFMLVSTQVLTENGKEKTKLMDSPFAKTVSTFTSPARNSPTLFNVLANMMSAAWRRLRDDLRPGWGTACQGTGRR